MTVSPKTKDYTKAYRGSSKLGRELLPATRDKSIIDKKGNYTPKLFDDRFLPLDKLNSREMMSDGCPHRQVFNSHRRTTMGPVPVTPRQT